MKLETLSGFARTKLRTSTATPDYAGKDLLDQVSRQTSKLADISYNEWQQAVVADATVKGSAAGKQENVTYQSGNTLTAQAFNQAAVQSVMNSVQFETTLGMRKLNQEHVNNPAKYKEESDAFINDTVMGLKENAQTAGLADITENTLRLTQQSDSYRIDKT